MMMWSAATLASPNLFHISALSFENLVAYTLMIVKVSLFENWRVMNWALPSMRIPLALIRGAIVMSTVMEVLVLSLCECPIGIP
jgi:hypothetical protein